MKKKIAAIAAASMLVLAACGSDDSTSDTTAAPSTTVAEAGTIVEVASANDDFSTLVEAITAADLATTLSGDGPFTVFAPTNAAFEALATELDTDMAGFSAQMTSDIELLKKVLLTHVYGGKVMAADTAALDGQEVELVSGEKATVSSKDGAVSLTIGASVANVVTADVEASNGVIHIVDKPLLPLEVQN
jgi:uncharacterized surface protein with fasciclin (FAS1) repeats